MGQPSNSCLHLPSVEAFLLGVQQGQRLRRVLGGQPMYCGRSASCADEVCILRLPLEALRKYELHPLGRSQRTQLSVLGHFCLPAARIDHLSSFPSAGAEHIS